MSNSFWINLNAKGKIEDFYDIKEEIGMGASAVVKLTKRKGTDQKFAVKIIPKTGEIKLAKAEVGILLTLKHPNIIKLQDIFEDSNNLYMVLEYASGGELFDRIVERGYYSEKDAAKVVREILKALQYLHSKDVIHRDLKPENLLYSDDKEDAQLKVADFGFARINSKGFLKTTCGTPGYVSPEVLMGKNYTEAVDLWAVGVILYILLCGYEPFHDDSETKMFKRILKGNYEFHSPYWNEVSENAKDLIRKLLVLDPKNRLSAASALEHPWVKGVATNFVHMDKAVENLKEFNSRKKMKAAVHAITATNSLMNSNNPSPDFDSVMIDV